ncbi:MAG TPA: ATP-dependent protease subunit HslV [Candidatus Kryptobacter bacterium]|nr:MAG: HslU--HslV peptidase proteolytic subunit [Ignavibacteriae bacterium 37-53-5]HQT91794.1 ATP-dependent protease subunit HslV [Candidatus Kryptobacter bacterium]
MLIHGTTVIGIIKDGKCAIGSDGQVTIGQSVMKSNSKKVRKLYNDTVIAGFAGASADAFTLFERFEDKLQQYHGNLSRAAVELTKDWRLDKYLRRLEALLAVMNKETALLISGSGDVVEPDDKIVAIGSGGNYALAAARVLVKHTNLNAREIVLESLDAASDICIYTNKNFSVEEI